MAENGQELELQAGDKKIKIRGSDWLSLFGVAVGVLVLYMVFEHKGEEKDYRKEFITAVKEVAVGQREMVSAQREQNCLIAVPADQREKQVEFCRRMARDR